MKLILSILVFISIISSTNILKADFTQSLWENPDGGQWTVIDSVTLENKIMYIRSISCLDSLNWITYSSDSWTVPNNIIIKKTSDGGNQWENIFIDSIYKYHFPLSGYNIVYQKNRIFISCDSGAILTSSDGGYHWSRQLVSENAKNYPLSLFKLIGNIGLVYCRNGKIYLTEDNCKSWNEIKTKTNPQIDGISYFSMPDSNTIIITGYINNTDSNWIYFSSYDRGHTWNYLSKSKMNTYNGFYKIEFIDKNYGWSVASRDVYQYSQFSFNYIYYTTDGGKNWKMQYSDIDAIIGVMGNLIFNDSLNGLAISPFHIYLTSNGGKIWNKYSILYYNNPKGTTSNYVTAFPKKDLPIISSGPKLLKFTGNTTNVNIIEKLDIGLFSFYPNPVMDQLYLKHPDVILKDYSVELINLCGQTVFSGKFESSNSIINVENYPSGAYGIIIRSENKIYRGLISIYH